VGSADFAYSDVLSRTRDVWTARRIVDFAVQPASAYAGTSMPPVPLTPKDREDLEQYLEATPLASQRTARPQ
jgi:cytochrome c2